MAFTSNLILLSVYMMPNCKQNIYIYTEYVLISDVPSLSQIHVPLSKEKLSQIGKLVAT